MGTKRPFQEDDFPELSFKHAKQLGFNNSLNSYFEDFSSCRTSPKSDTVGKICHLLSAHTDISSKEYLLRSSIIFCFWFVLSKRKVLFLYLSQSPVKFICIKLSIFKSEFFFPLIVFNHILCHRCSCEQLL